MTEIGFPDSDGGDNVKDQIEKYLEKIFNGSEPEEDQEKNNKSKTEKSDLQIPFIAIEKEEGDERKTVVIDPSQV